VGSRRLGPGLPPDPGHGLAAGRPATGERPARLRVGIFRRDAAACRASEPGGGSARPPAAADCGHQLGRRDGQQACPGRAPAPSSPIGGTGLLQRAGHIRSPGRGGLVARRKNRPRPDTARHPAEVGQTWPGFSGGAGVQDGEAHHLTHSGWRAGTRSARARGSRSPPVDRPPSNPVTGSGRIFGGSPAGRNPPSGWSRPRRWRRPRTTCAGGQPGPGR
jgi:hypothetical protein